jgi:hypothetical protein
LPQAPNIIVPRESFEPGRRCVRAGGIPWIGLRIRRFQRDVLGLGPAAAAGVQGVERSHLVGGELEWKRSGYSAMRSALVDFGMTERLCWMPQRSMTCAGLLPCAAAIRPITGSWSAEEWPLSR